MRRRNLYFAIFLLLIPAFALCSLATETQADENTVQIPETLKPSLDKLLGLTVASDHHQLDMDAINRIVDYLLAPKDMAMTYSAGVRKGATSNYYEFTLNRSLQDLIQLAYNPDIPSYFVLPASLHQSSWLDLNGQPQPLPNLSKALTCLAEPVLIQGMEHVVNTPDTYSGAYYTYDLNRAIVLANCGGHRVLLSMSSQKDKSDVGKKGLVVGKDEDWNYLYTGEKGCTRSGLGWASTYMYDSDSIMVYYEMTDPTPHLQCAVFKWVDAGWAGINMAQPFHIKKGVERFVNAFKQIVESSTLPTPSALAATIQRIDKLPMDELKQKVRDHYNRLKKCHQNDSRLNRRWFTRLFDDGHYIEKMSREELKAVLCKEYLKYLLGKSQCFDIALLRDIHGSQRARNPG
jgi:hypothetical protein